MLLLFHPREKNSRPPVSRTVRSPCASPRMKKVRAALTCPDSCFIFLFDLCSFSLFNCGLFLARWRKAVRTVRMRAGDKGAQGRRLAQGGGCRERARERGQNLHSAISSHLRQFGPQYSGHRMLWGGAERPAERPAPPRPPLPPRPAGSPRGVAMPHHFEDTPPRPPD